MFTTQQMAHMDMHRDHRDDRRITVAFSLVNISGVEKV